MIETKTTAVLAAFKLLLEEMEAEIERATQEGAAAFARRDYARVEEMKRRAERLTEVRHKVAEAGGEWRKLIPPDVDEPAATPEAAAAVAERRNLGRLQRGVRTPEEAYRLPILRALAEMGGSARMSDVLIRVEQMMRGTLRQVDYELLESRPDDPRWRNGAQWARNTMVKEGLLKHGSPWGVWEISDAGRRYLAESGK
jgi:restriction system protein